MDEQLIQSKAIILAGGMERMIVKDGRSCMIERIRAGYLHGMKVTQFSDKVESVELCLKKCLDNRNICSAFSYVEEMSLCKLIANAVQTAVKLWGTQEFVGLIKDCSPGAEESQRPPKHVTCGKPYFRPKSVEETNAFRIVRGSEANPYSLPWMVSVQRENEHRCGGTIIALNRRANHSHYVLTAAHCFFSTSLFPILEVDERIPDYKIRVVAGVHSLTYDLFKRHAQIRKVGKSYIHPRFAARKYFNDIAVIKTQRPFEFTNYVSSACLPDKNQVLPVGIRCLVSGWGHTSETGTGVDRLKQVYLPILSDNYCRRAYGSIYLPGIMTCAGYENGGADSCQGDSGGPFVCYDDDDSWYLHGVVSFGYGCARRGQPGIYTRVAAFMDWINQKK
ncbi:coagulation factor IX [Trichuris trichiura]|uniref:limulus clotting factor C n=1 Tax=Trichuris trichiura TaxID=36087 RepID=A0A077Z1E9_TRITR|nr:coagulation factor IX [Trichuris trichiura]